MAKKFQISYLTVQMVKHFEKPFYRFVELETGALEIFMKLFPRRPIDFMGKPAILGIIYDYVY